MLVAGLVHHRRLPPGRDLRPADRAVRLRPAADATGPFGAQQPPSAAHIWGTTVGGYDVFSRVIWGAQTAILVIVVAVVLSIFARRLPRPGLRLLRRLARPRARRRLRRDLRVPVAAAGDRHGDRDQRRPVEPLGRHPGGGDLDHRRVHPAVLPGDPRRRRCGSRPRRIVESAKVDRREQQRGSCSVTCCATPPGRCR